MFTMIDVNLTVEVLDCCVRYDKLGDTSQSVEW